MEKSESFRPEYFAKLAELEAGNFWFRTRHELIVWALGNFFPNAQSFLEIGCGTGFVLAGIANAYPQMALFGSEVLTEGLMFAARRVPRAELMQMDARAIPFVEHFDVIGAFDVLEHIREDEIVLAGIQQALKPGGGLLLTVPQHQRLWSWFDEYSCHIRRYGMEDLHAKLFRAGFKIVLSSSFVSLLLPAMLLSRFSKVREGNRDLEAELKLTPSLDEILERILQLESRLIRKGISFPFGGSRLIAAQRV